jgi:uroporphyrinogen decarboxylase
MSMTPRERWLALFARQKPDRVPTDYWATPEVTERLLKELRCENLRVLCIKLHIDLPETLAAVRLSSAMPRDPLMDIWGVRHRIVKYGTGEYREVDAHPLAAATSAADVAAHPWPDPEAYDWDHFAKQVARLSGRYPVRCGTFEPFLLYCAMRGLEQSMADLVEEPEIADAILERIYEFHYRHLERMFEAARGKVDFTYVAEDLGSQSSLLIGLPHIRRYLLPNQKRVADLARHHGIHVFYHTDGAARDVLPDLISVTGIEALNPIQWRCPGMEREGLVRDFGDHLIFHGAMDNQFTLPFGSAADVQQEVLDNLRIFAGARWICAPCHNLQPVSPTANIVAMYEAIWDHGRL